MRNYYATGILLGPRFFLKRKQSNKEFFSLEYYMSVQEDSKKYVNHIFIK